MLHTCICVYTCNTCYNHGSNSFKQEALKGTKMSGFKYDEKQTIYIALRVSLHRYLLVSKGKTVTVQ